MEKYTYSIHQSGYVTVKDLFGDTIAVIDFEEKLSFTKNLSPDIKQEVTDFLLEKDIPFFC